MCVIKKVSDMTKMSWDKIWDMSVFEFLNYATFAIGYERMVEEQIKQWKMRH